MKKTFFHLELTDADAARLGTKRLRVGPYYGCRFDPEKLDVRIRNGKSREKFRWITVATAVKRKVPPSFLPTNGGSVILTEPSKKIVVWEFSDPWRTEGRVRAVSIEF